MFLVAIMPPLVLENWDEVVVMFACGRRSVMIEVGCGWNHRDASWLELHVLWFAMS